MFDSMALNQEHDELFIVISRTKDFDLAFERKAARTTDSMPGPEMGLICTCSFADNFDGRDEASDKLLEFDNCRDYLFHGLVYTSYDCYVFTSGSFRTGY